MNYTNHLQRLYERRRDHALSLESIHGDSFNKSICVFSNSSKSKNSWQYVEEAMKPLPKRSTEISYEEGDKIKCHLDEGLKSKKIDVTFRYQGSVTCNTHIKGASDIDLLVITEKFYTLEHPLAASYPYKGDPISDMQELRNACHEILSEAYPVAKIDNTGAKSIRLSGGSLRRDIDVVPANWFNSLLYDKFCQDFLRGVQVFDKNTKERTVNYPFYNQRLIEEKDKTCYRLYRPLIRLAKNLREDSEKREVKEISSYDIQALFYNMPNDSYYVQDDVDIVSSATQYMCSLLKNSAAFSKLYVPDKTRKIADKLSIVQLKAFYTEFYELTNNMT